MRATPSVLWGNTRSPTTTLEAHIIGREDVRRVWITGLGSKEPDGRRELFDDGTHGDRIAGDRVYTLADVSIPFNTDPRVPSSAGGWQNFWGYLRVQLADGTHAGNDHGLIVGLADKNLAQQFPVGNRGVHAHRLLHPGQRA